MNDEYSAENNVVETIDFANTCKVPSEKVLKDEIKNINTLKKLNQSARLKLALAWTQGIILHNRSATFSLLGEPLPAKIQN